MRKIIIILLAVMFFIPDADARRKKKRRSPRVRTGFLVIHSTTDGATVMVDGKEMGLLPLLEPLKLPTGKHTLKVTKRGFTEFLDVFKIRRRKTTSLEIDLLPFAGFLEITANKKESRVFLDGDFIGIAPMEKEILIGEHSLRITKAGFYDFISKVRCVAGKSQTLHADLKPLPIGTTPYRPKPPPPRRWYEKWYIWAGAAGGVAAITLAIVLPVTLTSGDIYEDMDHHFRAQTATAP